MKGNLRRPTVPDDVFQLNGREVPFLHNVTYLGVTFNRRMTWKHHIERNAAKALRVYLMAYFLFKYGPLSSNIKLIGVSCDLCLYHMGVDAHQSANYT
jgi:hypothetical protein